ncbi:MAG: reverse transcriptase/maturase family protein [Planctomycetota bacterium]
MKRYGALWNLLVSWENLVLAARKAQRGKRDRTAVQAFNFDQERQLLDLQGELESTSYRPGAFRSHWISRPKPRMISAAPYRDRVVHHALMNVLEPILDRHFHPGSYACRKGKGTHAAADRLQELMGRYPYALQGDVRKFFPSIDHQILKKTFRRLIKDPRMLWLMDLIVDSSNEQEDVFCYFPGDDLFTPLERRRGLPIGNLTSQWFANWMLTGLDHYVTSHLRIGAYVRYCDDFIMLHHDRVRLREALAQIKERLAGIRLELHGNKAFVKPVRAGLTFLGYRIWPTHRLLRKDNVRRFRRRVRWMRNAYGRGEIDACEIRARLLSWMAHARHANSERLIRRLSREWRFRRDGTDHGRGPSRRLVEQQRHQPAVRES